MLLLLLSLSASAGEPMHWEGVRLHLSLDDAPMQFRERSDPLPSAEEVEALNQTILGHLSERGVEASVFFNCDRMPEGEHTVEAWHRAGHVVGNHTADHSRLDEVGPDAWLADVDRCHEVLAARLPQPPTWFRYTYLNHGSTAQVRDAAAQGLTDRGYRNVPITVATSDWVLAFAWLDAQGDPALQERIGQRYVQHMVDAVDAARDMARLSTEAEVTHTVLVHVNPLNAEWLDEVLDAYAARGATFVDLQAAMADPVYAMDNQYTGGAGISWLARIAPDKLQGYWFGQEEGRLQEEFLAGEY